MKIRNIRRQAIRRHSDMLAVVNASLVAQENQDRRQKRKELLLKLFDSSVFWIKVALITLVSIITMSLFMSLNI